MAKKAVTPEVVVDKKAEKQRALNTAMAQIEREIEKRMEAACEKNGWVVAVAMMPPETLLT